jgi:hypothetical protein
MNEDPDRMRRGPLRPAESIHAIAPQLTAAVPGEIDAAAEFTLAITAAASSNCDCSGVPYEIVESGTVLTRGQLPPFAGEPRGAEIRLRAPERVGRFEWTLVVQGHDVGGVRHEGASVAFSFRTRAHATNLVVWDVESPVVVGGGTFTLKVGAKCAAGCGVSAHAIELRDSTGATVAAAVLADGPWPGTTALRWGSVKAPAPIAPGLCAWSVQLPAIETPVPHDAASCAFTFVAVPPPAHVVDIRIVEKETSAPVSDAHVRLGAYRALTDEAGVARFAVSGGTHRLCVSKAGYDVPERTVDVNGNEQVQLEAVVLPEEDPDAYWRG